VSRVGQLALGLGHAALWGMVVVALLVSSGYVQRGDEVAQAAAERQTMACAVVDIGDEAPGRGAR
jgi:hypothetical protein